MCDVMQLVREANEACRRKRERERERNTPPQDTKGKKEAGAGSLLSRPSRKKKKVSGGGLGWIGVDWGGGWGGRGVIYFSSSSHI